MSQSVVVSPCGRWALWLAAELMTVCVELTITDDSSSQQQKGLFTNSHKSIRLPNPLFHFETRSQLRTPHTLRINAPLSIQELLFIKCLSGLWMFVDAGGKGGERPVQRDQYNHIRTLLLIFDLYFSHWSHIGLKHLHPCAMRYKNEKRDAVLKSSEMWSHCSPERLARD